MPHSNQYCPPSEDWASIGLQDIRYRKHIKTELIGFLRIIDPILNVRFRLLSFKPLEAENKLRKVRRKYLCGVGENEDIGKKEAI